MEVLIVVFKPLASIFQSKCGIFPNSSTFKSSTSSKTSIPIIDHHSSTSLHCIFRENDYYFNDSTMADKCISCNQTVTTRQQAIQCDGCLKWNHRTCNTGKLNFFFHSISSSRSFSSPCSFMKYPLCYPF